MREGRLAFDVYKKIKEGILSLAYPPGATLQERQIAEQFGVSRTPVREAIQCLAEEGWLVISARRYILGMACQGELDDVCADCWRRYLYHVASSGAVDPYRLERGRW